MSFITIPYSYKNNQSVGDCGIENLIVPTTDFALCGLKYFTLRVVNMPIIDGQQATTFEYNGDTYTITTLTPTEAITLLASAFSCPNNYCNGQVASFDYTLTPLSGDKWVSQTIVNEVETIQPDLVYSITDVTVAGITYGTLPHVIWDDTDPGGNASTHVADYIDAIIAYIASLSIPTYIGAVNRASNGVADNLDGTGLLELYFTTGTTVIITIDEPTEPIAGTFTGGTLTTYMLKLLLEDTSTQSPGDVLVTTNYEVSDGLNKINNSTTPDSTVLPYNIFCGDCGLDPAKSWILNLAIVTQNTCTRNNVATGFILAADIQDSIATQSPKTGSSVG